MALLLPEFSVDYLEFFYACARIDNPSPELLEWSRTLDDQSESDCVETSFETARGTAWIIAIAGLVEDEDDGTPDYVHFHLSTALNSFFGGDRDTRKAVHTAGHIEDFVDHFANEKLDAVRVRSKFVIPESDLPERSVADLLGVKASVGGNKVRIDSFEARFEDTEIPHKSMEWSVRSKDDSRVLFFSSVYRDRNFSDTYLREFETSLNDIVNEMILRK